MLLEGHCINSCDRGNETADLMMPNPNRHETHNVDIERHTRTSNLSATARPFRPAHITNTARRNPHILHHRTTTRLATFNCSTLWRQGEAELLALELDKAGVHICALQETREVGVGSRLMNGHGSWMYHWSGSPNHHERGVGLMVHPLLQQHAIGSPTFVNERMLTMSFNGVVKVTIVAAYAPTEAAPALHKAKFYKDMEVALKSIPSSHCTIVLGDMNAQVGNDASSWPRVVGNFGTFQKTIAAHSTRRPPPP